MTAQIAYLGDPTLHFWLTRSVARAVDVSLSEAMAQGLLSARAYADMVTNCRQCPNVSRCEAWLAENGAGAPQVPEHCANCSILNALAERLAP